MAFLQFPNKIQPEVTPRPGNPSRYTNKIHYLRKYVIDTLSSKQFALEFMQPIEAIGKLVNYYEFVKTPMDTILECDKNEK